MKNKEYKFRVWDKVMKRYWAEDCLLLQMDGKKIQSHDWGTLNTDLPNENLVICQYLNHRDIYERDLYENDIVKISNGSYHVIDFYSVLLMHKAEKVGNIFDTPEFVNHE